MTTFYKRVFPILWFGFCGFAFVSSIPAVVQLQAPLFILLVPLGMIVIGYVVMRTLVFDLLDEVYVHDDQIVIRNGGTKDRFAVSNILNVDTSVMTNTERITLTLREPCRFGSDVTFSPPVRLWPVKRHPLANELIRLAHRDDRLPAREKP